MARKNDIDRSKYVYCEFIIKLLRLPKFKNIADDQGAKKLESKIYVTIKKMFNLVQGLFKPSLKIKYNHDDVERGMRYLRTVFVLKNQNQLFDPKALCQEILCAFDDLLNSEKIKSKTNANFFCEFLHNIKDRYGMRSLNASEVKMAREIYCEFINAISDEKSIYKVMLSFDKSASEGTEGHEDQLGLGFEGESVDELINPIDIPKLPPDQTGSSGEEPDQKQGNTEKVKTPEFEKSPSNKQATEIKTRAKIISFVLDNSEPSTVLEGNKKGYFYFTGKTHRIILNNIHAFVDKKHDYLIVYDPMNGRYRLQLNNEQEYED